MLPNFIFALLFPAFLRLPFLSSYFLIHPGFLVSKLILARLHLRAAEVIPRDGECGFDL